MNIFAHGRKSHIFEGENNTVVKLYEKGFPLDKIHQEYQKAKIIWQSKQIYVPEPIREITLEGQHGIIFAKVEGIALIDLFQKKPWLYFSYIPKIAAIHKSIHQVHIENLPTQQQMFSKLIEHSERLLNDDKARLLSILDKKYDAVLCHGDFHHGNLIQTRSGETYIVDWMDAFVGAYQLDVALTAVNAAISTAPDHVPVVYRQIYEILKRVLSLDAMYLRAYSLKNIDEYLLLAAGIHLTRYEGKHIEMHEKYFDRMKK